MAARRPPWTCPESGARFVTRNLDHACVNRSAERSLKGMDSKAQSWFRRYVGLVPECEPLEVARRRPGWRPLIRIRFTSVTGVSETGPAGTRFSPGPRQGAHRFRVSSPGELDDDVRGRLRDACAVGEPRHLAAET